ncbi:hypothetical protein [Lelliottia amnigena]|uniref:hypothetical protein n=1 Tax=Lelliottia amnigena TaxID=61646 RepID=UPI002432DD2A|nr:hypothetical protein [Lelliottia amnigena]
MSFFTAGIIIKAVTAIEDFELYGEVMKLFHGTSSHAAELIESCGYIAKNIDRTYGEDSALATTDGYIYLTNHPGYAAYMANKEAMFKKADFFVVYEIDVEEILLEPDIDELIYVSELSETEAKKCSLTQSLSLSRSCRAPHNLYIGKEVIRKVTMPSSSTKVASDLMPTKNVICFRRENQESQALEILDQVGWVRLTD